jgi:hypothetical protein
MTEEERMSLAASLLTKPKEKTKKKNIYNDPFFQEELTDPSDW